MTFDRLFSLEAMADRIMGASERETANSVRVPNETLTPEVCDRPPSVALHPDMTRSRLTRRAKPIVPTLRMVERATPPAAVIEMRAGDDPTFISVFALLGTAL